MSCTYIHIHNMCLSSGFCRVECCVQAASLLNLAEDRLRRVNVGRTAVVVAAAENTV